MKATTTRTLNPLPFQDLEPHRFEDLVRQLVYEWRPWSVLEATGRSGTDDGFDIRAVERTRVDEPDDDDDDDDAERSQRSSCVERVWLFQCKREKSMGPARTRKVVASSLVATSIMPYGFVLAVASDVSKRSRDAFRSEMAARGIEEFAVWGKGELEDMLFQPKHDRLLFAYVGLSLQPRRRSFKTSLRAEIATKRQLHKLVGDEGERHNDRMILLRDPTDEGYPKASEGRWIACRAVSLSNPGILVVRRHEYLAAVTEDGRSWDAIGGYDMEATLVDQKLRAQGAWAVNEHERWDPAPGDFQTEYVDEEQRAHLVVYEGVPLEHILAIDPLGDGYYPIPHLLVEWTGPRAPFGPTAYKIPRTKHISSAPTRSAPDR